MGSVDCCQLDQLAAVKKPGPALCSAVDANFAPEFLLRLRRLLNRCRKRSMSRAAFHRLTTDCVSFRRLVLCLKLLNSTLELI